MTNEEAIKFLKQLYPYGGHCWLDGQRTEAIGMAIKALQEELANDSFEAEVKKLWEEINTGHSYSIVDSYNLFYGLCMDIAQWQKEQMMAKAVDGVVTFDYYGDDNKTYGCIAHDSFCLEDFGLKDMDKVKMILIKED